MTVWRQTSINITFPSKSCLKTYCSPLPALRCFSHPLPRVLGCCLWGFNSAGARGNITQPVHVEAFCWLFRWWDWGREIQTHLLVVVQKSLLGESPKPAFPWLPSSFLFCSAVLRFMELRFMNFRFKDPRCSHGIIYISSTFPFTTSFKRWTLMSPERWSQS